MQKRILTHIPSSPIPANVNSRPAGNINNKKLKPLQQCFKSHSKHNTKLSQVAVGSCIKSSAQKYTPGKPPAVSEQTRERNT